jgi:hypothetical protein
MFVCCRSREQGVTQKAKGADKEGETHNALPAIDPARYIGDQGTRA